MPPAELNRQADTAAPCCLVLALPDSKSIAALARGSAGGMLLSVCVNVLRASLVGSHLSRTMGWPGAEADLSHCRAGPAARLCERRASVISGLVPEGHIPRGRRGVRRCEHL